MYGLVEIYSGKDGTLLDSWQGAWLGSSLANAGDVSGDGGPDLLIGSFSVKYLRSGRTGICLHRWYDRVGFGTNDVAAAGDANGDGLGDLLLGAGEGSLHAANDLFLTASTGEFHTGDVVTLSTQESTPGNIAAVFFVERDGAPAFSLLAAGTFDALGTFALTGTIPSVASGHSFTLRAYAIEPPWQFADSGKLEIVVP